MTVRPFRAGDKIKLSKLGLQYALGKPEDRFVVVSTHKNQYLNDHAGAPEGRRGEYGIRHNRDDIHRFDWCFEMAEFSFRDFLLDNNCKIEDVLCRSSHSK